MSTRVLGRLRLNAVLILLPLVVIAVVVMLALQHGIPVLQPAGTIGRQERQLIYLAVGLSLLVVVPVYTLAAVIVWRYREQNHSATYAPDWDHDRRLETLWWAIPSAIILVLAVVTWTSSHALDPGRPLASALQPLEVQVVAMQWKWLFIYPEQGVATVNYLQIPVGRPIEFAITADAPMNSFWIPQLGGQIYAMSGMQTHLHLQADSTGTYQGLSANLSGEGFSSMNFATQAVTPEQFATWVRSIRSAPAQLDWSEYSQLARPGVGQLGQYELTDANLFNHVLAKFQPGPDNMMGAMN